jgi:hypothetical protein
VRTGAFAVLLVFLRVFWKKWVFLVGFLWWKRGGLRGECGAVAVTFRGMKNAPRI